MRLFGKILTSNRGATIVIVALAFTAIMALCALTIDFGLVVAEKSRLQNALDAAALAAAQELPDTREAAEVAREYMVKNGYQASDITITFADSNKTIRLKATKTVKYYFAKVLGKDEVTLSPQAAATCGRIGGAFDYVLFSGSTTSVLALNGSNFYIGGSAHTNYNLAMNGSKQTITGACEAVGELYINGSNISIGERIAHAPYVEMPDFFDEIKRAAEEAGQAYNGTKTFNGSNIDVADAPIYVNGDLHINGSNFSGKGVVLVTGNITFNGSNLNHTGDDAICFYSKNGDITINGSHAELNGIVYAPNGRINMNGSNQTIYGRVIGKEVGFNGSNTKIIGGGNELESLPSSYVKLIE